MKIKIEGTNNFKKTNLVDDWQNQKSLNLIEWTISEFCS